MLNIINNINSIEENIYNLNKDFENKQENGVNGEIDEAVYQGNYEDCWILSGVLAMSYTDAGEDVIHDSINIKDDGNINVAFRGFDSEYTIEQEELAKNNYDILDERSDYSTGDDDMLAIELAVEKQIEESGITKYNVETGGNPYYIFKMFQAENITVTKSQDDIVNAFKEFDEHPNKYAMTLGTVGDSVDGLKVNHGYTIKNVEGDNVILIDPWNTTEEITVSRNALIDNYQNISIVYAEF